MKRSWIFDDYNLPPTHQHSISVIGNTNSYMCVGRQSSTFNNYGNANFKETQKSSQPTTDTVNEPGVLHIWHFKSL